MCKCAQETTHAGAPETRPDETIGFNLPRSSEEAWPIGLEGECFDKLMFVVMVTFGMETNALNIAKDILD